MHCGKEIAGGEASLMQESPGVFKASVLDSCLETISRTCLRKRKEKEKIERERESAREIVYISPLPVTILVL